MNMIPYSKQNVNKTDKKIVNQSLSEKLITTGKFVKQFEIKTKKFLKSNYSLSCSSGTAAIHMALMSINLKKNECVIMPAINFIASSKLTLLTGRLPPIGLLGLFPITTSYKDWVTSVSPI